MAKPTKPKRPSVTSGKKQPMSAEHAPSEAPGHFDSLTAALRRRTLEEIPALKTTSGGPVDLPKAKPPSLENLEAVVPPPMPVTKEDLAAHFARALRRSVPARKRLEGEAVAMGDEVQLNVIGLWEGGLIPFSIRCECWMDVLPLPALPGFAEALVGVKVGQSGKIQLVLPADYPFVPLRLHEVQLAVDVLAARERLIPEPTDAEALKRMERGATLEEIMIRLRQEVEAERQEELRSLVRDRILDQISARTEVVIPEGLIDEEIRRRWGRLEGPVVTKMGFTPKQQQQALDGWLVDPFTRADANRRLRVSLGLHALAEKEGIQVTRETLDEVIGPIAEQLGISAESLKHAFAKCRPEAVTVAEKARHLLAVKHVMARATVRFAEQ
jgi:trigger factor